MIKKENRPKSRRIMISFDEYEAIRAGLEELECTIGEGNLTDGEKETYEKRIKSLNTLINKILS